MKINPQSIQKVNPKCGFASGRQPPTRVQVRGQPGLKSHAWCQTSTQPSPFTKPLWFKSIFCLAGSMGSYGDTLLQCAWCWAWGRCCQDGLLHGAWLLTDIDCLGVLCEFCFELEEPQWRPNNRQRCEQYMIHGRVLPPHVRIPEAARMLALCLASHDP